MPQNSEQYRKREEVEALIAEAAKTYPIVDPKYIFKLPAGPYRDSLLQLLEARSLIEHFTKKKKAD